jgi:iron complex outermembrane receptor protein
MHSKRHDLVATTALAAALLAGFVGAGSAVAQDARAPDGPAGATPEVVVVTGTRTAARTALESTAPVDVIAGGALAAAGSYGGELGAALQNLAPSFNFSRQSNSSSTDVVRFGQLRGMNPDQVVVLVNGRRRHATSVVSLDAKIGRGTTPVDFNSIPLSAVSRIEVLRDGAGAQYGSDAVAGVINVILKGAGGPTEASLTYGRHDTDFEPTGESRTDGETVAFSVSTSFDLSNGFLSIGGDHRTRKATARGGPINAFAFIFGVEDDSPLNRTFAGDPNLYRPGDPDVTDLNLWANGEIELGDGLRAYGVALFSAREGEGAAFYRYPDGSAGVPALHPRGYRPITTNDNVDFSLAAGLRGESLGWEWDAGLSAGRNTFDYGVRNSANPSLGAASPTTFHSAGFENSQWLLTGTATRETGFGRLAVGGEARFENYVTTPGDPASYQAGPLAASQGKRVGAQAGPGLAPADTADVDRQVVGLFAELSAEPAANLDVDVAARVENYSDVGSAVAGKIAARYEFAPGVAVRAAVSNSFRAPSLAQTAFQFTTTTFGSGGGLVNVRTVAPGSRIGQALGAPELERETSLNFSLGATARLGRFSFSIDAFRVDVDDRIIVSERNFGFASLIQSRTGIADVTDVAVFTNGVDTRTEGFDVVASWFDDVGPGRLNLTAAYNRSETEVRAVRTASSFAPGFQVLGVEERNTIESAAPVDRFTASGTYDLDPFSFTVRATRHGETTRIFNFGGGFEPEQTYGAKTQIDLEASFDVGEAVTLSLGGNNVTDEYPDRSIDDIAYFGALPYDVLSPIGMNGAFWYGRVSVKF